MNKRITSIFCLILTCLSLIVRWCFLDLRSVVLLPCSRVVSCLARLTDHYSSCDTFLRYLAGVFSFLSTPHCFSRFVSSLAASPRHFCGRGFLLRLFSRLPRCSRFVSWLGVSPRYFFGSGVLSRCLV